MTDLPEPDMCRICQLPLEIQGLIFEFLAQGYPYQIQRHRHYFYHTFHSLACKFDRKKVWWRTQPGMRYWCGCRDRLLYVHPLYLEEFKTACARWLVQRRERDDVRERWEARCKERHEERARQERALQSHLALIDGSRL